MGGLGWTFMALVFFEGLVFSLVHIFAATQLRKIYIELFCIRRILERKVRNEYETNNSH